MDFTVSLHCVCVCVRVRIREVLSWGVVPGAGVRPDLGCDALAKSPDRRVGLTPALRPRSQ